MPTDPSCTDCCPLGRRCESCGAESPRLRVVIHRVLSTTLCLTMCSRCANSGQQPQIMLSTAERLAAAHVAHLRSRDEPPPVRYLAGNGRRSG